MGLYLSDHYKTFNMLCVDPGVNYLGVSIMQVNTRSGIIETIDTHSLITDKIPAFSGMSDDYSSDRDFKLRKIFDNILNLCYDYDPCILAYETPFYSPLMPGAYGSLMEVTSTLRSAVMEYNTNIYIEGVSPQYVKKSVGAAGVKGKGIMKEKLLGIPEIMNALNNPVEDLSEHCIDSIIVGYAVKNSVLKQQENWK